MARSSTVRNPWRFVPEGMVAFFTPAA